MERSGWRDGIAKDEAEGRSLGTGKTVWPFLRISRYLVAPTWMVLVNYKEPSFRPIATIPPTNSDLRISGPSTSD